MEADLTPSDDRPKAVTEPDVEWTEPGGIEPIIGPEESDYIDAPEVSVEQVRGVLLIIGKGTHKALGSEKFPEHWSFTHTELDELAPPCTSIVNRSPRLRRAVHTSDYAALAVGLFGWAMRNVELSQVIEEEAAELAEETLTIEPTEVPVEGAGEMGPLYSGEPIVGQ